MLKTLLYFIAGNVATEVEKAAIVEAKLIAKRVIINCVRYVDAKYYDVDGISGVNIPSVYANHPNIIELSAHKLIHATTDIKVVSDGIDATSNVCADLQFNKQLAALESPASAPVVADASELVLTPPAWPAAVSTGIEAGSWGAPVLAPVEAPASAGAPVPSGRRRRRQAT